MCLAENVLVKSHKNTIIKNYCCAYAHLNTKFTCFLLIENGWWSEWTEMDGVSKFIQVMNLSNNDLECFIYLRILRESRIKFAEDTKF